MEVIRQKSNVNVDMSPNVFKDGGYWSGKEGSGGSSPLDMYESESPEVSATVRSVALHLEQSLRAAKKAHLSCGEVLLPPDLLSRVSRDIIRMAETEPCGLRGCLILVNFQSGPNSSPTTPHSAAVVTAANSTNNRRDLHSSNSSLNSTSSSGSSDSGQSGRTTPANGSVRNIGRVRWDKQTVTTFELHLTLREDPAPWYSRLPQILRSLTKGGTIVVSPAYTIAKKKLYRSH